jgi:hypothetical protein
MITLLAVVGFATGIYLGLRKRSRQIRRPRITH